ncbi:MAG: hypothetical protein K2W96_14930, partial [Gemmataceae bacterium]|nr:hypothetical protein [Gemmataceae bacterium]
AAWRVARPPLAATLVSAFGAAAGIVMLTAARRTVIAGALAALALVPIAAAIGGAVAAWEPALIAAGMRRLAIDAGFVLLFGFLVFAVKQAAVHRRSPVG